MILLQFVSSPFSVVLTVLERRGLALILEIGKFLLLGSALVLAQTWSFPPEKAVSLLSAAGTIGYLWHLFISWLAIRRLAVVPVHK